MNADLKVSLSKAVRYWESKRLIYNFVLVIIVVVVFLANWGEETTVEMSVIMSLFLLAFIANVLFCMAYIPDMVLRSTDIDEHWQSFGRSIVFLSGTVFAGIIAYGIADGISHSF